MSEIPEHREPLAAPTPAYSEAPEVYTTPLPTSPPSDISAQNTGSVSAMNSYTPTPTSGEKQYPFQPDSVGEIPTHPNEKNYPNQPEFQHQQGPQQFYTPQAHPSGYATAVPLHGVQSAPCPVDCPACGERELTRITPVSGGTTHGWAAILCFCCCLGCIPYLMSSLKDVEHSCGKCGAKLAVWHNSGRVQVLQNGARK